MSQIIEILLYKLKPGTGKELFDIMQKDTDSDKPMIRAGGRIRFLQKRPCRSLHLKADKTSTSNGERYHSVFVCISWHIQIGNKF